MSNIAISEIQNSVDTMKSTDLMLVSKAGNSNTYTTAKTTFDKIIRPCAVYCNPQNELDYSTDSVDNQYKITICNSSHPEAADNKVHWQYSNYIYVPSDYVTIDGYFLLNYGVTTDFPEYGLNMYVILSDGTHERFLWRTAFTLTEGGIYHFMQPVTIAKETSNYVFIRSCNVAATSTISLNMYW